MNSASDIVREDAAAIVKRLGKDLGRLSGKTMLVTGGNGLIGAYFADVVAYANDEKLLAKPCRFIGIQKTAPDKSPRIRHLIGRPDMRFIAADASRAVPEIAGEKIDFIVHAAGFSAPALFQGDPLATIDVNVNGIRWLLEMAKEKNAESLLYMSSGEIYGDPPPEWLPTPETYPGNVLTYSSRACYTESKRLSETLCVVYAERYKVPAKIARPFVVYGPGLSIQDRRVMADFMRSGIEGKPIVMMSEGRDTRSYCYIADAMVAFFNILFSAENGTPFNVANDHEEVSIYDLATLVHEITGINVPVSVPAQKEVAGFIKEAPHHVRPDITKLRTTFHFEPSINLETGLRRTIDWNIALAKELS
jgi:dTDP-glucose 4,6-dehydratase/UDP-glucuronate decarboxylase